MSRGDKTSYSPTQRRKAEHIEKGYKKRGESTKSAQRIAWATVNKQDGGPNRSGRKKRERSKKGMIKRVNRLVTEERVSRQKTMKR